MTIRRVLAGASLSLGLIALGGAAQAQNFGGAYPEQTGEQIYKGVCQGCHMPDAKGAKGAGAYPALAGNAKLAAKTYPVFVVVRGLKAMPDFGGAFSDAQVAEVVNYVRTHFGNAYADAVTPADVQAVRPRKAGAGEVKPPG